MDGCMGMDAWNNMGSMSDLAVGGGVGQGRAGKAWHGMAWVVVECLTRWCVQSQKQGREARGSSGEFGLQTTPTLLMESADV